MKSNRLQTNNRTSMIIDLSFESNVMVVTITGYPIILSCKAKCKCDRSRKNDDYVFLKLIDLDCVHP